MKHLFLPLATAMMLMACGKPAPTDTVESLVANPERLKELRAQCKADHDKVGNVLCQLVSEATRRRFMGSGTPYTSSVPPAAVPKD